MAKGEAGQKEGSRIYWCSPPVTVPFLSFEMLTVGKERTSLLLSWFGGNQFSLNNTLRLSFTAFYFYESTLYLKKNVQS